MRLNLFIVAIQIHILLRFLALCLCLQHFDNDLLLLNQESTLDPGEKHEILLYLGKFPRLHIWKAGCNIGLTCHGHSWHT